MTRSRLALALALAVGLAPAAPLQAQYSFFQWTSGSGGNGHWYAVSHTADGFSLVEAELATAAADLTAQHGVTVLASYVADVLGPAEQTFLTSTFAGSYWIGLVQDAGGAEPAGGFAWTSGQPVDYTNWCGGEPNDASGSEDGVIINWCSGGGWNDIPLDGAAHGILEFEAASTVPEPLSLLLLGTGLAGLGAARRRGRSEAA